MRVGLVGALAQEVGPVAARFAAEPVPGYDVEVVRCGVGKVNAALTCAALAGAVDAVLFGGIAGGVGPDVRVGDVVIGTEFVQHDVDCTMFGLAPGQLNDGDPAVWRPDPSWTAALADAARAEVGERCFAGRIATGDQFVAGGERLATIRRTFDPLAVEMEGAAIAQACTQLGLPFALLRVISDAANDDAVEDFDAFAAHAGQLEARILHRCLAARP